MRDLGNYRYLAFGILLVAVMVFRPQGFWPARAWEPERPSDPPPEPVTATGQTAKAKRKAR
jgi:branched-chain amino acid transport system permease protein